MTQKNNIKSMSIHRGLIEMKRLDERIDRALGNTQYIYPIKKIDKKYKGMTREELSKEIISDYDSIVGIIKRRDEIKRAIVMSNSITTVVVAGVTMTVAEAIEKKASIEYEKSLLRNMELNYRRSLAVFNNHNESIIGDRLDNYIESITGSSKEKLTAKEVDQHTETFMARNSMELLDPLKVNDKINTLSEEISNFESEVDAVLSESNAITTIEISA